MRPEAAARAARDGATGVALSELENRLLLGKSTVTELVLRSEERGLVRRELDRSRRRGIRVALTPKGERQLAKVVAELGDERRRLLDILSKLAD